MLDRIERKIALAGAVSDVQALPLAEKLGMCPLLAHCPPGLGQLYGRTASQR